jgi:hypothetical protein
MGRRLCVLGAAISLAALAVGVVGPALGSSGDDDKHRTFRVTAVITELSFVDVGDQGASLGDEIVFSNKLLKGGKEVGHEGAVCTTVSLERQEAQCIATFSFQGGQITAQALVRLGDPAPYAVAITGGTGKYEGAEGEIRVRPVSETSGIHIFRLED